MTNGKRYGAYHRISRLNGRDLDAETTMSDKDAFEQMDAWAKMRDSTIADRYLDSDVSGSKLARPELNRMLADLDAGRIDGIVVAQVDRLSRADVGDALTVVKRIVGDDEAHPRPLVLLDLGIDPSTEFGEFGLTILLGLARMQWRRYKRQWTTAQRRAVQRGVWIGPTPFGYRATKVLNEKTGKLENGPLEPDENAVIVKGAFRVAANSGLHAAMAYLQEMAPDRRWRTDEARSLLNNPVYLGELRHGKLINDKAHKPLTNPDMFSAAQTEPRSRRSNGAYPLSGVATCHCGAPMVGALQTVRGKQYRRMRCSAPACKGGSSISADKLEGYVRATLKAALGDGSIRLRFVVGGLEDAREALEDAEAERTSFATDVEMRSILGDEAWRAGAVARSEAVDEARVRYQEIASQAARSEQLPGADELDDDRKLLAAVAVMVASIRVESGRGSVEQRVGIDFNDGSGMLAA